MAELSQQEMARNPFERGPYLQIAAFCDQVIEGKDGVLSLIRVIDTLTHTEPGPEPPLEMPPLPWKMVLVLVLKAGSARGRHEIKVVPGLPSGETKIPIEMSVHLEGEERGARMIINVNFTFTLEGLYWFSVYFDDTLLTRLPFRVKYVRVVTGPPRT